MQRLAVINQGIVILKVRKRGQLHEGKVRSHLFTKQGANLTLFLSRKMGAL